MRISELADAIKAAKMSTSDKKPEEETIYFSSQHPEYGWLSNFAPAPFKIEENTFKTVEHAFQYSKMAMFGHMEQAQKILATDKPASAKALGRKVRLTLDEIQQWSSGMSLAVMKKAVSAKFRQNPDLKQCLLATGDAILVEKLPRFGDRFWGVDKNGEGENHLGKIIMQVRKKK